MRNESIQKVGCLICLVLLCACGSKDAPAESTAPATETTAGNEPGAPTAAPTAATPAASAAEPAAADVPPGAREVRAAMAKKDYEAAVGRLISMRATLKNEHIGEFGVLQGQTREELMVAAETDRKAAEALMTLRHALSGQ
jgi:hypothetical protein